MWQFLVLLLGFPLRVWCRGMLSKGGATVWYQGVLSRGGIRVWYHSVVSVGGARARGVSKSYICGNFSFFFGSNFGAAFVVSTPAAVVVL